MEEENKVVEETTATDEAKAEETVAAEEEVKAEETVAAEEEVKADETATAEEETNLNLSGDQFEEEKTVGIFSSPTNETVSEELNNEEIGVAAAYAENANSAEVYAEVENKDAIPKSRFAAGLMAVFPGGGLGCADFYVGNKKHAKTKLWVSAICLGVSIILYALGALTIWFYGIGSIFISLGTFVACGYFGMYTWSIVEGILYFTGKRGKDAFGNDIIIDTQRSRYAAYWLGYWAGFGGAHNFYLGNKKNGIIQAAVTGGCLLFCWIPCVGQIIGIGGPVAMWIWAINEAKALKNGTVNVDGHGRALRD